MKRKLAAIALLALAGLLLKWALKPAVDSTSTSLAPVAEVVAPPDEMEQLIAEHADGPEADLVRRVVEQFGLNAVHVARADGLPGLRALDRYGLEAFLLFERDSADFRTLQAALDDDAAAAILIHWREYFGLVRDDPIARAVLLRQVDRLPPAAKKVAARYPNALPLLLAEPEGVAELVRRWSGDDQALGDALAILALITLEQGATDLRTALRTLDDNGPLALEAFRLHGPEGFALVGLYGAVLEVLGEALPLNQALVVLRVNMDYVDHYLATHQPEALAGQLRHVAATNLVRQVGGSVHGLRLAIEYGAEGELALRRAGADAADVAFETYQAPDLRRQAVAAMAAHGPAALVLLDKYASDPDFCDILRAHGPAIIPPLARADAAPDALAALRAKPNREFTESLAQAVLALSKESGQTAIRQIKDDGIARAEALYAGTGLAFYQFLPLYDVVHLGKVMAKGYTPTAGELSWALVDGCFVVADALSLVALQPQGAAAAEAVRAQVKVATKGTIQVTGRDAAQEAIEAVGRGAANEAKRWSRWWAVRKAGGTYAVLSQSPEAVGKMTVEQAVAVAAPVAARAGLRLSVLAAPVRWAGQAAEALGKIPPRVGLKYVAAQMIQAGVGVVGVQKMDEYLKSRRAERGPI